MVKKILSIFIAIIFIFSLGIHTVEAEDFDDDFPATGDTEINTPSTDDPEVPPSQGDSDSNQSGDNQGEENQGENNQSEPNPGENNQDENNQGGGDSQSGASQGEENQGNNNDENTSSGETNNDFPTNPGSSHDSQTGNNNSQGSNPWGTGYIGTSTLPANENKKSSNANLKILKVDKEDLKPEFKKDVTEYYLVVDLKVEEIKVTAEAEHEKAKVSISGNKDLKEGKNTITIKVTAEDETEKKYYIYVTKVDDIEKANAELKSLKVKGYELSPSFKSNIYNYNLNLQEKVTELEIIAEAEKEKAKVKIEGDKKLKEGENLIKIQVTAEDGKTVVTYKINAYIFTESAMPKQESKLPAIILLSILGASIIGIGAFMIIKNKN